MNKWKWIIAWISGFGEVALQVDEHELAKWNAPTVKARRLTIYQLRPAKGGSVPVWAKWFPLHFGVMPETFEIRRESIAIWADAPKAVEDVLLQIWTGLVTTAVVPPAGNGNLRRLPTE